MVDLNKLKGKIVERGLSVSDVAEKIGIDKATLYRKLNSGGNKITIGEADLIAKVLELSSVEASAIFFISASHK